ncbi:class I SAM-dependent methyltransferase [Kineosporia succinea]|uniref:SAM-dependent methyltransferase n=1 Tax=Kineosporia succinea TaxID=84632 RepID=A0ABT9PET9_9ACTN|nr:class I SAM-dependent methyltransferase [Kineosporia succinea]MDP9831221.1 SAM-dependent methyltransferase [Kineosporia succinea]
MSSREGKDWIRERVTALAGDEPMRVLDIGPGVGTYAKLLADLTDAHITGIEIYEPYVHTYRLHDYYDEIVVGDAREVPFPAVDVVILGDVAEHMSEADALGIWKKAQDAAALAVYLSIPIVHYPQGEIEGNPHEVHVDEDWDHDRVISTFSGIGASWTGTEVGVYECLTS